MTRSMVADGGIGMQRPENQVSRLRGLDGNRDRLEVAQLSDHHDVGVLAKRRAERGLERLGMASHLPLIDQAVLVLMDELDGVLDGDDVIVPLLVDEVHHRRERGGLSRAGGPRHEDQPLAQKTEVEHGLRQAELLRGQNRDGNRPKDRSDAVSILEHVHAEAGKSGDLVGAVDVSLLFKDAPRLLVENGVNERPNLLGAHDSSIAQELDLTVDPQDGNAPGAQVEIRTLPIRP